MKRFHIHLSVNDLDQNIRFYSTLFGCSPSVRHDDYAKWMLDDPRVNFAISSRSAKVGVDHLGIQTENELELHDIKQRLDATQRPVESQEQAACCYMRSDKYWITDPQGIAWESFHSLAEIPTFNDKTASSDGENPFACRPENKSSSCCGG
ncbi:ArsI/CadI family heavy metal resistance metalloenzyme [Methylosarcina fibrata]|uniref:ArsI/CadI family heavy metal resistance metalloenzyme n=1 Tax=Methylosarcina fibrata TaxID=105972 RepID=UPI00037139EB|nr:ArsI/CadI family heavy metal resistance metalloenzyme [Methylosarcina fibrata]